MSDDGCDPEDVRTPICGHRQPYISLVVEELIDTEKAYVKDLRDVVHVSITCDKCKKNCGLDTS